MKKLLIIILIILFLSLMGCQTQQLAPQLSAETELLAKLLEYEVVEEKDVSYYNCNRLAIRIIVPDNSSQEDVDYTLQKIISERKHKHDAITAWAWKYSEKEEVGISVYTMGMKQYDNCK